MIKNKGVQLALITALISGVSVFVNKFAVASFQNPVMLPAVKNSLVGLMFLMVLIRSGKLSEIKKLNRKQLTQLLLVGIIGGSVPFYLFFTGLSQIPAINAALIHKSLVMWVALLAVPLLGEKVTKSQGFAVLLLLAGNLMIGGFKGFTYSKGELMVLFATILWALETILVKKVLPSVDVRMVTFFRMGMGSLLLVSYAALTSPQDLAKLPALKTVQWFWISVTALTLFGYVSCWYRALKYAPAVTVSGVLVLATLITNILSAIFVTHTWNILLTVQGLVLLAGTVLAVFTEIRRCEKRLAVPQT